MCSAPRRLPSPRSSHGGRRLASLGLLLLSLAACAPAEQASSPTPAGAARLLLPPSAPRTPESVQLGAEAVLDPYRRLGSGPYASWFAAQNEFAHAVVERLPERTDLAADARAHPEPAPTLQLAVAGGAAVFTKFEPAGVAFVAVTPGHARRQLPIAQPTRDLMNPIARAGVSISPDGRFAALGWVAAFDGILPFTVVDLETGEPQPGQSRRIRQETIAWRESGGGFFYQAGTEEFGSPSIYRHVPGTPMQSDAAVIGPASAIPLRIGRRDRIETHVGRAWLVVSVIENGDSKPAAGSFAAPLASVDAGAPSFQRLKPVAGWPLGVRGDDLYVVAGNRVSRVSITHPEAPAVEAGRLPDGIDRAAFARDAVYGWSERRLVRLRADAAVDVIDVPASFRLLAVQADPFVDGVLVLLDRCIDTVWRRAGPGDGALREVDLGEPPERSAAAEWLDVEVAGAPKPVSLQIVAPRGAARDGSHPAMLYAGRCASTASLMSWVRAGGVLAACKVPPEAAGSVAELTQSERDAERTFAACADALTATKLTSPARLGARALGSDRDGTVVLGAVVAHPAAFGAVAIDDGQFDATGGGHDLRKLPSGEPRTEAAAGLSPYLHLPEGTALPPFVLKAQWGFRPMLEAGKLAAKLRAGSKDPLSALLFMKARQLRRPYSEGVADEWDVEAFLLHVLGGRARPGVGFTADPAQATITAAPISLPSPFQR